MKTKAKFIGIAPLTGRKIYLTPEEEKIIKQQHWKLIKTFLWIFGIIVILSFLPLILIWIQGG
jgi:hypothetical protein